MTKRAKPKSESLACPRSSSKMFSHLRSLCAMLWLCRYWTARTTPWKMDRVSFSGSEPRLRMYSSRSPRFACSMITHVYAPIRTIYSTPRHAHNHCVKQRIRTNTVHDILCRVYTRYIYSHPFVSPACRLHVSCRLSATKNVVTTTFIHLYPLVSGYKLLVRDTRRQLHVSGVNAALQSALYWMQEDYFCVVVVVVVVVVVGLYQSINQLINQSIILIV